MKKILALALIALIAVTAVFAIDNMTVVGPENAKIKYQVTGLFDPAFTLTADKTMDLNTFVVDAGSNKDSMVAGSVTFTVQDKSNFNDAQARKMDITFTVGNFILQGEAGPVANPTGEQTNAITLSTLAKTEGADEQGKSTVSVDGLKLTVGYNAGVIVNRTTVARDVATLKIDWGTKRVQAGQYIATITINATAE